jgi:nucleoside-diphosphate-sugar epimerase
LITGASGMLGGAMTAQVFGRFEHPLVFLVRADSRDHAVDRLVENTQRYIPGAMAHERIRDALRMQIERSEIIVGDMLYPEQWAGDMNDELPAKIDRVIHCAANTFFGARQDFVTNLNGARNILESFPDVSRFVHVSTAFLCDSSANGHMITEQEFARKKQITPYGEAKAATESMLKEEFPNRPIVVARPSILIGHSILGCMANPSLFWVFRLCMQMQKVGWKNDTYCDSVPFDYYAASALEHLAYCDQERLDLLKTKDSPHPIVHISTSEASSTWGQCFESMARVRGLDGGLPEELCRLTFRRAVPRWAGSMSFYQKYVELSIRFSNKKLMSTGFREPPKLRLWYEE